MFLAKDSVLIGRHSILCKTVHTQTHIQSLEVIHMKKKTTQTKTSVRMRLEI